MAEPLYEFVKGKGWVLTPNGWFVKAWDGTRYQLFDRYPVVGEHYVFIHQRDFFKYRNPDGTNNMANIVENFGSFDPKLKNNFHKFSEKGTYLTIIKVI